MTAPLVQLEPVDAITITTLIDNLVDATLADSGPAKRPRMGDPAAPRAKAAFLEGGETPDALLAEHGFSALVTVTKTGRRQTVTRPCLSVKERQASSDRCLES